MIRFGKVTERDNANGLVRVEFQEDGIVSKWISAIQPRTGRDKFFSLPDVNEHVACMMDEFAEEGVVLGAVYSKKAQPAISGDDVTGVEFEDGSSVQFDRSTGTITVNTQGDVIINATGNVTVTTPLATVDGDLTVTGNLSAQGNMSGGGTISASGNIESTGGDVKAPGGISLLLHKHPTAAPGPPSPPIP
jgi:phage baseplate assembly protein V